MTVCVATIASSGAICGAADRMLTKGATQTEPASSKIYHFDGPPAISVMWAGSSTMFGEVLTEVTAAGSKTRPMATVRDWVDRYCNAFGAVMGARAERAVLVPLGLSRMDLVSSKVTIDRAKFLIEQVTSFCLSDDESVEVLVAGHDETGPHLWRIANQWASCHDLEGFAAIGIGADHADAQLRFAGYTKAATSHEAAMMAFLAKKRAEVAPGVGRTTDMFMRGQGIAVAFSIPAGWLTEFDVLHAEVMAAEKLAISIAVAGARGFLTGVIKGLVSEPPTAESIAATIPPDAVAGGGDLSIQRS